MLAARIVTRLVALPYGGKRSKFATGGWSKFVNRASNTDSDLSLQRGAARWLATGAAHHHHGAGPRFDQPGGNTAAKLV